MGWSLIEHDLDVVPGVPVADVLLRVLADRQVSPTILSSSLFCHAAILRRKVGSVNFRLCSRRRFILTRQVASTRQAAFAAYRRGQQRAAFSVPPAGFTEEKRQGAGAVQDASRGSEAIGKRASVLDCGGPPPLSIQRAANRFSLVSRTRTRTFRLRFLKLMGCSPHSFLRVQMIQFPEES